MVFDQEKVKERFNLTISALEEKLKHAAVLTASPAIIENIEVEYQGYKMKLNELSAIRLAGPRSIIIEPWDKGALKEIMAAIFRANVGATPVQEKNYVRLSLPPITGEDKDRIIKKIKEIKEQSRVSLRHIREDFLREFDKAQKEKLASEDQKFKNKEILEKITKEYNEKIDSVANNKIKSVQNA